MRASSKTEATVRVSTERALPDVVLTAGGSESLTPARP